MSSHSGEPSEWLLRPTGDVDRVMRPRRGRSEVTNAWVSVDTDEVKAVAAFYRRTALVLDSSAGDLTDHRFGAWAHGSDLEHLGERFAAISAVLTARLREQSASAADLAAALTAGVEDLLAADADAARAIGDSTDERQT